jgi:hypothetical protein
LRGDVYLEGMKFGERIQLRRPALRAQPTNDFSAYQSRIYLTNTTSQKLSLSKRNRIFVQKSLGNKETIKFKKATNSIYNATLKNFKLFAKSLAPAKENSLPHSEMKTPPSLTIARTQLVTSYTYI